ncbi:MAG: FAD binding domain-containing protein [Sandaracinaceae bacterium]
MYPPKFDYVAPSSVDEVLDLLADHGEEAKVLAGGQSLIPVLKLRFASPDILVDINRVSGLSNVEETEEELVFGTLVRHNDLARSDRMRDAYPVVWEAGRLVADPLVRNLGSVGGSLVHADPQADWGSVMLAMNASVVIRKKGAERRVPMTDFFQGIFTTAIEPDELLTEVRIPRPTGKSGGAYLKMERKVGDFATAGVAVHLEMDNGTIRHAGIGLTAMGTANLKATDAEQVLAGQAPSPALFREAAEKAASICSPRDDVRGTAEFKVGVVKAFVERGLARAVAFAQGAQA